VEPLRGSVHLEAPIRGLPPVVADLADRLLASLAEQLVGVYLGGSLSVGDFEPATSDYDVLVVTAGALSSELLAAIGRLHEHLLEEHPDAWRLEGDYAPRELLVPQGTLAPVPGFRHGVFVPHSPEVMLSADNMANMRQHGIPVFGPPPQDVLPEATVDDVRTAVLGMLRDTPEVVGTEREAADEILNIARSLCALGTGEPTTKTRGAEWALAHLDPRWRQAVESALALRRGEPDPAAGGSRLRQALSEMVPALGLRTYH
jgi:hypothetical protein